MFWLKNFFPHFSACFSCAIHLSEVQLASLQSQVFGDNPQLHPEGLWDSDGAGLQHQRRCGCAAGAGPADRYWADLHLRCVTRPDPPPPPPFTPEASFRVASSHVVWFTPWLFLLTPSRLRSSPLGASFTRFQTLRLQKIFPESLANQLISYGSCQFPTLGFVVERFKAIQAFIPETFYKIKGTYTHPAETQVLKFAPLFLLLIRFVPVFFVFFSPSAARGGRGHRGVQLEEKPSLQPHGLPGALSDLHGGRCRVDRVERGYVSSLLKRRRVKKSTVKHTTVIKLKVLLRNVFMLLRYFQWIQWNVQFSATTMPRVLPLQLSSYSYRLLPC